MLNNTKFYRMPIDIVRTNDLTDFEKILFAIILDQAANFKNNVVAAKNNYYAEFLNKSIETIQKSFNKLKKLGLIQIETHGNKRTIRVSKDFEIYYNEPKIKSKSKNIRSKNELPNDIVLDEDIKAFIESVEKGG